MSFKKDAKELRLTASEFTKLRTIMAERGKSEEFKRWFTGKFIIITTTFKEDKP